MSQKLLKSKRAHIGRSHYVRLTPAEYGFLSDWDGDTMPEKFSSFVRLVYSLEEDADAIDFMVNESKQQQNTLNGLTSFAIRYSAIASGVWREYLERTN